MTETYWLIYALAWALPSFILIFWGLWNHPYDDFTLMDLAVSIGSALTLGWIGVLMLYGPRVVIKKNQRNKMEVKTCSE